MSPKDELFGQWLVNMKSHSKAGDLTIVKMFETGYKSAKAKAGSSAQTPQLYAKRLYLPQAKSPFEAASKEQLSQAAKFTGRRIRPRALSSRASQVETGESQSSFP